MHSKPQKRQTKKIKSNWKIEGKNKKKKKNKEK